MSSTFADDGSLSIEQLPQRVRAVLAGHTTLVLATTSPEGQPEAASVFFAPVVEGGRLLLVTAMLQTSRKLAHLRADPRAAVYIGPQEPTCWIQAECTIAEPPAGDEHDRRLGQLTASAPDAKIFVERVPVSPVVLSVTRLKLTDLTGEQPPLQMLVLP